MLSTSWGARAAGDLVTGAKFIRPWAPLGRINFATTWKDMATLNVTSYYLAILARNSSLSLELSTHTLFTYHYY